MSQQNQLSRYGAISKVVDGLAPGAKLFLVSDSDDTTVGPLNLGADFPVDNDGVARVYTTIQAAVNAASAGRGDVVAVLPGYDHTLGRADSWATAGVKILGIGEGLNRPTVRFGAATDEVGVAANSVTIENLRFLAAATGVTRGLDLDTGFSGAVVRNNVFDFNATGNDFITAVRDGQARTTIEGNQFLAEDTTGASVGLLLRAGSYKSVKDNYFYGQFDSAAVATNAGAIATDTAGAAISGLHITHNTIVSTDTAAALLINIDAGLTHRGIVADNRLASYDTATTDTAQVVYGTALTVQNWFIDADSDTPEELLGQTVKLTGIQDS